MRPAASLDVLSDAAVLRALGSAGGGVVGALMRGVGISNAPQGGGSDLMVTPTCAVEPDAALSEVARVMTEHHRKIVPVVDAAGRLLGIIDRADLLNATHGALLELTAVAVVDETSEVTRRETEAKRAADSRRTTTSTSLSLRSSSRAAALCAAIESSRVDASPVHSCMRVSTT